MGSSFFASKFGQLLIHAAFAGAGAMVGFIASAVPGLGLDPNLALFIGTSLGSAASRLQAKSSAPTS